MKTALVRRTIFLALLCSVATCAANLAVGLVTSASGARIRRAGAYTDTPAYIGDLVFAGDTVFTGSGSLSVAFCPTSLSYSISPGILHVESKRVRTEGGKASTAALPVCELPPISQDASADLLLYADTNQTELGHRGGISVTPVQSSGAQVSQNLIARVSHAAQLEKSGHLAEAAAEYRAIAPEIPRTTWSASRGVVADAQAQRSASGVTRTMAVVIGISRYSQLPASLQLNYADEDAKSFYQYLTSARGGAKPKDVILLLNEQAKKSAIISALATVFGDAKPTDRAVLFIAAHGVALDQGPNRGAYILANDSDLEDLKTTAVPMPALQTILDGQYRPQDIQMFVDACHADRISTTMNHDFTNEKFNRNLEDVYAGDHPSHVFGFMASRQQESSYECPTLQHGAFTYFLLRGIGTNEAADDPSGRVTVDALSEYVREQVRKLTAKKQNPEPRGNFENTDEIANLKTPIPQLVKLGDIPQTCAFNGRGIPVNETHGAESEPQGINAQTDDDVFETALRNGILLPGQAGSAFDELTRLRASVPPSQYVPMRNRLLVALEEAGQQIILQYLKGEAVPMTRDDFLRGEQLFAAAAQLLPNVPSIQARFEFFRGRRLLFDHDYRQAEALLEDAIRLDPDGAYSYNALGIALLELANFTRAVAAFRDAIQLAPYWAYARHNLGLALTQQGQYSEAIQTYRSALDLRPQYGYIAYNLGLLLERLNRVSDAREAWHEALSITPDMARAWNAIGLSYFLENRLQQARHAYETALSLAAQKTDRLAVRHDLALLLVREGDTTGAEHLWRENLGEQTDDVPSLIGLSDTLIAQNQNQAALAVLSALVTARKDYLAGRLTYAKALLDTGHTASALEQLQIAQANAPRNAPTLEKIGDLYAKAGASGAAEARELYGRAISLSSSQAERRRIRAKLQKVSGGA